MHDEILSRLESFPTSHFVYSSLSFYGSRRGDELRGPWFTAALDGLGIEEGTVRQTLWRMERSGELFSRQEGRSKAYSASPTTRGVIGAGTEKILGPAPGPWDGEWTLVHFGFDSGERRARDGVRDVLGVEGFAGLGPGLYVHPRPRARWVLEAVEAMGLADRVETFRGPRRGTGSDVRFARRLWDLSDIAARYRAFLDRFEPLADRSAGAWEPESCFAVRFAVVFEYLEVAWDDPELPLALLPSGWPGLRARTLARRLYETLLPGAIAWGDRIRTSVSDRTPSYPGRS